LTGKSAQAVVKASTFCHATPILKFLHWLKINERVEYDLSLTYRAYTTAQPTYLHSLISVQPRPRGIRSSSVVTHLLWTTYIFYKNHKSLILLCITSSLVSEMTYTVSSGTLNHSIPYHSPYLWNQLPVSFRQP